MKRSKAKAANMTTNIYLPRVASLEQALAWLEHETGEHWSLPRLIESGIRPWVWIDYSAEHAAMFSGRLEGYLAPLTFGGDSARLAAGAEDATITFTRGPDGQLLRLSLNGTPLRCSLAELRFMARDIEECAQTKSGMSACTATPANSVTKRELVNGLDLVGTTWESRLSRPDRDGKAYLPALVQRATKGNKRGSLWNPITFAKIAVEKGHLNKGRALALFKKAWPRWEDEIEVEIGEI